MSALLQPDYTFKAKTYLFIYSLMVNNKNKTTLAGVVWWWCKTNALLSDHDTAHPMLNPYML